MKILRLLAFLAITTLVLASCANNRHQQWENSPTAAGGSEIPAGVYYDEDNEVIVVSEDTEVASDAAISAVGGEKYLTAQVGTIGKIGISGGALKDLYLGDTVFLNSTENVELQTDNGSYSGFINALPRLPLEERFGRLLKRLQYLTEHGLPAASAIETTSKKLGTPAISVTVKPLSDMGSNQLRDQSASPHGSAFCGMQPEYAATLAEVLHVNGLVKGLDYFNYKHEAIKTLANVVMDDAANNNIVVYNGKVLELLRAQTAAGTMITKFGGPLMSGLTEGDKYMTWKVGALTKEISFSRYSEMLVLLGQAFTTGIIDGKLTAMENSEQELRKLWAKKVLNQIDTDLATVDGSERYAYVDPMTAMSFKDQLVAGAPLESLVPTLADGIPLSFVREEYMKLSLEPPALLEEQKNAISDANRNLLLFEKIRKDLAKTAVAEEFGGTVATGAPVLEGDEDTCTNPVIEYRFYDINENTLERRVYRFGSPPFEINLAKVAAETANPPSGAAPGSSSSLSFEIPIPSGAVGAKVWLWGFLDGVFMFKEKIFDGSVNARESLKALLEEIGRAEAPATESQTPDRAALPSAPALAR